jgi:Asparagine synthase
MIFLININNVLLKVSIYNIKNIKKYIGISVLLKKCIRDPFLFLLNDKKWILKQIAHKHLPKEMLDRPKKGFSGSMKNTVGKLPVIEMKQPLSIIICLQSRRCKGACFQHSSLTPPTLQAIVNYEVVS